MKLNNDQENFVNANGHTLVIGGPGSGKTTVSIFKAAFSVENKIQKGQKVLFLSFARPTVARVIEAIEHEHSLPKTIQAQIEVETYHAFFWRLLKTHNYLIGLPRKLNILTPSDEAIKLSTIRDNHGRDTSLSQSELIQKRTSISEEQLRLARDEGLICFDLFAPMVSELITKSLKIRKIIANRYPIIILDEFQDTDSDQWDIVKKLGEECELIALADPEQRIYEWKGADPNRIDHYTKAFLPTVFDFGNNNYRSDGTDILLFANEVLKGVFSKSSYDGLVIKKYTPNKNQAITKLVTEVYEARKRLVDSGNKNWSLAILVPTKKMTRNVSDALSHPPGTLSPIHHSSVIDMEPIILASEILAFCLQSAGDENSSFENFIELLASFFEGRGGDRPTKQDLSEAVNIRDKYKKIFKQNQKMSDSSILKPIHDFWSLVKTMGLTGNPEKDWVELRSALESANSTRLKEVGREVRFARFIERGESLRMKLAEVWRDKGSYENALTLIRDAFVREHFSTSSKPESGIVVMNMHKAKGKQFDEVIMYESRPNVVKNKIVSNYERFVWNNDQASLNDGARYNMRVSITRGKSRVTILTPSNNPCVLLPDLSK